MPLPTDAKVEFLICDAARQNPDGKLDIAGFYPTGDVKLDATVRFPAPLNLTFIFVLRDGDGRYPGALRIVDPLGKDIQRFDLQDIEKLPGTGYAMILPVAQMPVSVSGHYGIVLEIDRQPYKRTVHIFQ
jgi:hypothetical protein